MLLQLFVCSFNLFDFLGQDWLEAIGLTLILGLFIARSDVRGGALITATVQLG